MVCHQCGKTVQRVDRFCTGCGTALHEFTDAPPAAEGMPPDSVLPDPDAVVPDPAVPDPALVAEEPTELLPSQGPHTAPSADDSANSPPTRGDISLGTTPSPDAEPTELVAVVDDDEHWEADRPVWAATGATPVQADTPEQPAIDQSVAEQPTGDLPTTEPITEVQMDPVDTQPEPAAAPLADATTETPYDFVEQELPTAVATTVTPTATAEMPAYAPAAPAPKGFRFGAISAIAVLTGLVALVSLFANVIAITSSTRLTPTDNTPFGFRTGSWIADDLADNLSIAGLLAIVLMIAGGVASGFHWRWGAGLAGGAGLAMAGIAALTLGLAQIPIDAAHEFAGIPNEQQFTLTITRDLGYWLMVAAGALGVVLFFAAINDASGDRRSGLNPWIAAVGALAAVVAAAGPLIPENQAVFSDNWYVVDAPGEAPAMLLVGRLVQLGLLLFAGVVGFLTVRRWGLGLAIGGSLPIIWLATSTLFDLTDRPVGPGFRNPGAEDMHIHGVTIIGVSAIAAMAVLAVIAAYDQAARERP